MADNKRPDQLIRQLENIPGGYVFDGQFSYQVCFPLQAGGALRFSVYYEDDPSEDLQVDLYKGSVSPGLGRPTRLTGKKSV